MEAYLQPTHFEPASGALIFSLAIIFLMINIIAAYMAASCARSENRSSDIMMSRVEFQGLFRKAVSEEMKPVKNRMAVREDQMAKAIETALISEVRITALEDDYNKAMKEMGALQADLAAYTTSSSSDRRSRASSHSQRDSDVDGIYGPGDETDEASQPKSPVQAPEIYSPQIDQETVDELAELGGWSLNEEPAAEVSDGNVTDADAEGETDDEYESPALSVPTLPIPSITSEPLILPGLCRKLFRPLSACKTKGARTHHEEAGRSSGML
ncbi:hypothetical protein EJ02DRAFT_490432 [Clathrospora elynae]|uniref:Uncharacterized protein n=1 Tax=Clathrospora elynae TaxID=706981 RepID=A0A6A5SU68_9PLEO|nr:hypothetical protein EJ02DRAFT_490432 [Clathrospora elynae]